MKRDIIVVGASAGGVEALQRLVRSLPSDLPAAVLVVMHRIPYPPGLLPDILDRAGPLPVSNAADGEVPRAGHIYVAPPDRHLLLERGSLQLTRGPKENFSRPAIDPLFRSAAHDGGARVVGVILTGTLFDGTAGLAAVRQHGGFTIVQDPRDAAYSEMPENAVAGVNVDRILPLDEIAKTLDDLARGAGDSKLDIRDDSRKNGEEMASEVPVSAEFDQLPNVVEQNRREQIAGERHGVTSIYTCPDCGGTLWQAGAGPQVQFRCHVGHAYSAEGLAVQQDEVIERSLWFAIRTLQDRFVLLRQLAENARKLGNESSAQHFEREAGFAKEHSETLRQIVEDPAKIIPKRRDGK